VIALLMLGVASCSATFEAPTTSGSHRGSSSPRATSAANASASVTAATVVSAVSVPSARLLDVHIVPLGDVPEETLTQASLALTSHAPLIIVMEKRRPLPTAAKTSEKGRYSADRILEYLSTQTIESSTGHGKIVGVTELDIVTPKNGVTNWGVLGLGTIDGQACVFSTYRMKRAFEKGGGASETLVRERLWKIALHELGHTLGLEHCPNVGCIMEDAAGTVKTVDTEVALCPRCAGLFSSAIDRALHEAKPR
jgi:archaemetzincin